MTIDKQALREAAEKVNSGEWSYEEFNRLDLPGSAHIRINGRDAIYCLKKPVGGVEQSRAVTAFIAAFNPKVALALLDEVEAAEHTAAVDHEAACSLVEENEELKRRITEMESKNSNLRTIAHDQNELAIKANLDSINDAVEMDRLHKRIAETDQRNAELTARIEPMDRRIAELEARTVILPEPISVLYRRDFTDAHREIYAYPEAEVNAALADAGIKVKGVSEMRIDQRCLAENTFNLISMSGGKDSLQPGDLSEWADMQLLLWDAQRRAGITDEQITQAMIEKLAINKSRQWPEPKDGEPRLHIKEQPVLVMPADLHPDTQNLVADFCTALAEKLYGAQLKYGYDADWKQDGWATQCLSHFHQHIAKGDPRDVAAYCAFMWYHGWKTESVSVPVVPEECPADISVLMASHSDSLFNDDDAQEIWNACRAAMLQSKYRDLSQPVDPQISEYERIMLRAGWVMVPVEPTDEMIAAAMNCEDVLFNSDESFCVQFGNIYEAMLAAAPQPEENNG